MMLELAWLIRYLVQVDVGGVKIMILRYNGGYSWIVVRINVD